MIEMFLEKQTGVRELTAEINRLLTIIKKYMSPDDVKLVSQALVLARTSCQDTHDERPIPPLEHALAVATILAEMHIDAIGVASGVVFEAVDAGLLPLKQVEQTLGFPIARIVDSMLRLNILERKKQVIQGQKEAQESQEEANSSREQKKRRMREDALRRQQFEKVRKMFFAVAEDPRVVLLKLAYRLHAMRLTQGPLYYNDPQEVRTMAQETREIYAPLAGRLSMSRVDSELQDLAFQILEPETYAWICEIVEAQKKQSRSYVDRVCHILRKEMAKLGLKAEVFGRVKHLYSFYKKVRQTAGDVESLEDLKKAADLSQIQDLIAFRILVETVDDCYTALGHVSTLWKPKEGWFKDFIHNPKSNGYRSLHTTVYCLDDQLVEIQIRTFAMHEMAEYGIATQEHDEGKTHAHWHYKDASTSRKDLQVWVRRLAEWQRDLRSLNTNDVESIEEVRDDIFQQQIFVFTPKGEVKDLPAGSTPLDFAYRIHTNVGDKCAGARILTESSGDDDRRATRMVPLDYELKSGEIVDILTSRAAHPTRDWLNFARTPAAKNKIRRYLKTHERHINIQIGRERLDRELKVSGTRSIESMTEDAQKWLSEEYRMAEFEDLLAAIGADDVRPHAVTVKLTEYWQQRDGKEARKEDEEPLVLSSSTTKQETSASLQVAGVSGLLTKLATCCCPLPGDEIIGFISRGKGVIVHRADCRNLNRSQEREYERLISVSWSGMSQTRYLAPVVINARDRAGLIRDIATVISDVGANVNSMSSRTNASRETVTVRTTLEINDMEQVQRLFTRLGRVKDVTSVERDLGKRS